MKTISTNDLRDLLERKVREYNRPEFTGSDPVSIPRLFTVKEDIEIAGFLAATLSWGRRPAIIRNARALLQRMDFQPYDFVMNAGNKDTEQLASFAHRTFNGTDCIYFVKSLRNIYRRHGGLEKVFHKHTGKRGEELFGAICGFREVFFSLPHPVRTGKHISDPGRNSAAKRINMFLRWMVRSDNRGVDFGIWKSFSPAMLFCPLDTHSGTVARKLGLLQRSQNDWKAVVELTVILRLLDPEDPIKYDFALFGLGVFEPELLR